MLLFFDTETTGLPVWSDPSESPTQPRVVQIAAVLCTSEGKELASLHTLIKPEEDWPAFAKEAIDTHQITPEFAKEHGAPSDLVLALFADMMRKCKSIIGHNVSFDVRMMRIMFKHAGMEEEADAVKEKPCFCTMKPATNIVKAKHANGKAGHKWPKLEECMRHFFNEDHVEAHDAMADVRASMRVYRELLKLGAYNDIGLDLPKTLNTNPTINDASPAQAKEEMQGENEMDNLF